MPTQQKRAIKRLTWIKKLIAGSLSIVTLGSFAQQTVTLHDAIVYSLKQHPELKSFTYMKEVANGLVKQASVASPVTIKVAVEDALGSGRFAGVASMQTTLSISWLLEQDIIASRVNVANQKSTVSAFKREVKVLDIAAETARVFIILLSQKEQLTLAKLAQSQAKALLNEINIRVKAGRLNVIDELRARADLSKKSLVVEDLLHEIEASKAQLAAQWQGNTAFSVDGTLLAIPTIAQVEMAYDKLKSNPRLQVFASQQRIADSELALAKTSQKPAWSINAGIKRNEAVDDFAFTAGLTIPLGSENRNQGKILALQAKKNQSLAESDAWFKRISTQLLLLTHKLKHSRHVIEGLANETIPVLELARVKAEKAYKVGRYRYTDLYAVQQELITSQIELIQAYTNIQLFNIELERLTGSSISM